MEASQGINFKRVEDPGRCREKPPTEDPARHHLLSDWNVAGALWDQSSEIRVEERAHGGRQADRMGSGADEERRRKCGERRGREERDTHTQNHLLPKTNLEI